MIARLEIFLAARTRPVAIATMVAAAVNLGLNILLVPRFGIAGSGIVMPLADENSAGLLETKRMSSYLSSAQNLVTSFQCTGDVARSSR